MNSERACKSKRIRSKERKSRESSGVKKDKVRAGLGEGDRK